jgi:hypothetical protein
MNWVGLFIILCIPLTGVYGLVQLTQREAGKQPSRLLSLGLTLVVGAFLVTLVTSLVPVEITPQNSRADFGFPFRFVTADTGLTPPQGETSEVGYDPWEHYAEDFHTAQFLASWALVSAALLVPLVLLVLARRRARGRPPRPCARPSA